MARGMGAIAEDLGELAGAQWTLLSRSAAIRQNDLCNWSKCANGAWLTSCRTVWISTVSDRSERDLELGGAVRIAVQQSHADGRALARGERYKGFDEVIERHAALTRRFPNLRYLIVGDGADRARLEAKATSNGLSDNVIFAGTYP